MRKKIVLFFCATLLFFSFLSPFAVGMDRDLDGILNSAEQFFKVLQGGRYAQTWSCLSARSRDTIVDDMYKGLNGQYSREQIMSDLKAGGMLAAGFWKGVLKSFDPRTVLENSTWGTGEIGPRKAELLITGKKSSHPARLYMFNEAGEWKVGLVESFWTRKK